MADPFSPEEREFVTRLRDWEKLKKAAQELPLQKTKEGISAIFAQINNVPLRVERMFMHKEDFDDIIKWVEESK